MTTEKTENNGFLAGMVRIVFVTASLLSPVALCGDWMGESVHSFSPDKPTIPSDETGSQTSTPADDSHIAEGAPPPLDQEELERWTRIAHPKAAWSKSPQELDKFIKEVMATSMRIDVMERKRLRGNKAYKHLSKPAYKLADGTQVPPLDAYVHISGYNAFKATFGKGPDEFGLAPVRDIRGNQFVDTRSKEHCFALQPAAERWEQLNEAYHKRTKGQVQPDSCLRSRERQLATKAAQVITCANTQSPKDAEIERCMHETRLTSAPHLTGDHVWGVAFDSHLARTKAKKEAKAAGFFGGCRSSIALSDKDHQSLLLTKKGGKGTWAACQVQVGIDKVTKGAKKLWKKITN